MRIETIGNATLYLGDCREIIGDLRGIDLIVTSPPYNQLNSLLRPPTGSWGQSGGGRGFVEKWQSDGYTDDRPEAEYQDDQNTIFAAIRLACNDSASLFYNHQLRWRDGELIHPMLWFAPDGWRRRSEIIWDRCGGMMMNARMFCRYDERILWFTASDKWKWNQPSTIDGTIWRIPPIQNKEHPVAFPEAIPARCIAATTDEGDLVLDPFSGSGTTGISAIKQKRRYIGIEQEMKYFDLACRQIDNASQDLFIESKEDAVAAAIPELLL